MAENHHKASIDKLANAEGRDKNGVSRAVNSLFVGQTLNRGGGKSRSRQFKGGQEKWNEEDYRLWNNHQNQELDRHKERSTHNAGIAKDLASHDTEQYGNRAQIDTTQMGQRAKDQAKIDRGNASHGAKLEAAKLERETAAQADSDTRRSRLGRAEERQTAKLGSAKSQQDHIQAADTIERNARIAEDSSANHHTRMMQALGMGQNPSKIKNDHYELNFHATPRGKDAVTPPSGDHPNRKGQQFTEDKPANNKPKTSRGPNVRKHVDPETGEIRSLETSSGVTLSTEARNKILDTHAKALKKDGTVGATPATTDTAAPKPTGRGRSKSTVTTATTPAADTTAPKPTRAAKPKATTATVAPAAAPAASPVVKPTSGKTPK